jgi:hypothetical protein
MELLFEKSQISNFMELLFEKSSNIKFHGTAFRKILKYQISWNCFSKNPQISNFMEIRPVGAELFHADGWTDMTKLIVAFRNFANKPKNWESVGNLRQNILRFPYYLEVLDRRALLRWSVRGLKVQELNYTAPRVLGLHIPVITFYSSTRVSGIITFLK